MHPRPTIKLERRFRLHVMGNLDRQVLKDSTHVGGRAIIMPMLQFSATGRSGSCSLIELVPVERISVCM